MLFVIATSRIPVFIGALVLVALVTIWEFWSGRRDQDARRAFAASIGGTFEENDASLLSSGFAAASLKSARSCRDVIRGSLSGERFTYFRLVRTSGQWSTNTAVVMIDVQADMPHIWLGRGRLQSGLTKAVGDEVLVGSESFKKAFKVRCADPTFASVFLNDELQEWLLRQSWGVSFEAMAGHAFVTGGRVRVSEAQTRIETATRFASLIGESARTYRDLSTDPSGHGTPGV